MYVLKLGVARLYRHTIFLRFSTLILIRILIINFAILSHKVSWFNDNDKDDYKDKDKDEGPSS